MTHLEPVATFIGANRQTEISDYNKEYELVAYGAGNLIALWNPLDKTQSTVHETLKGHIGQVTSIKFLPNSPFMVSTSEDHHVKLWKYDGLKWGCVKSLEDFKSSVVTVTVLENLICLGCADGKISIWRVSSDDELEMLHEFIAQPGFYPLCMSLSNVLEDKYLLAVGGTNVNILLYSFELKEEQTNEEFEKTFKKSAVLEGHEDWIKSLTFRYQETKGDYLLASGSQDRYIRLWRIRLNELIDNSDEDETKLNLLSNKQYKFNINDLKIGINFEALIMGHDDWISSLKWHCKNLQLLATTADTCLMIWEPDEVSGIWVCRSRLGEISSKGASTATGSVGGFWSCLWFQNSGKEYILTNGRTGSFRIWSSSDQIIWDTEISISGCVKEVTDIAWAPSGKYLLSTSLDQTTRLFAKDIENGKNKELWHEFSRPQIHGYDMICVEPVTDYEFVSGGDEKILRSFDMTQDVNNILKEFCDMKNDNDDKLVRSAALPALGLSNKGNDSGDINNTNEEEGDEDEENNSSEITSQEDKPITIPIEDDLQRKLLWVEIEKLYGHGYEMIALDINHKDGTIASTCRSNSAEHSMIKLFDMRKNWVEINKPGLKFHNLTVTRVKFNHDGQYLLSVCRDRSFALWERQITDGGIINYQLKCGKEKAHTRIIWDCDWFPTTIKEENDMFVTGSRDKSIKIWEINNNNKDDNVVNCITSVKLTASVTGVGINKELSNNEKVLLAIGLENGDILIYSYDKKEKKLEEVEKIDVRYTPGDRISRIRWNDKYLAVSSNDNSVRIYKYD